MKTYKIKSLVYFSGFLLAATLYYVIEQKQNFDEQLQASQMVDLAVEEQLEEAQEDSVEEQP